MSDFGTRGAVARAVASVLLAAGLFFVLPTPAEAHGGRYIPPVTPLGPPGAPRVPLVPPPLPPGLGPSPTTPGPGPAPATQPGTLPSGPRTPFAGRGRRAARPTTDPNAEWQTWWNLNRLAYLPDRDAVFARRIVTPRIEDDPRFSVQRRVELGQVHVVPFLLSLLDSKVHTRDDVTASALLALGRVSQDPGVVEVLFQRLADERAAPIVRESAALALGLLRRTDPCLQFDGIRLDDVRERLFETADDSHASTRTRAFAVLAVGLLGDQPFGTPYTRDGRLAVRGLWQRLGCRYAQLDVPVALLTALGMQPPRGVPDGVREGLRRIAIGKQVQGRRWGAVEQGHALTAMLRLGGPSTHATLLRVLGRARTHRDLKRAAYLALGRLAERMAPDERIEAAQAVLTAQRTDRDPLTRGLGHIGLGHLLGADLRAGHRGAFSTLGVRRLLLSQAENGPTVSRGFSLLGLSLACRRVPDDDSQVASFLAEAAAVILGGLERSRGDAKLRSAYAVGAGLAGLQGVSETLVRIVDDRSEDPGLRGHAAVALGQIGLPNPEVERVLALALADPRDLDLRRQAALALALLGTRRAATQLVRQLAAGRTEHLLAQVVVALGRLGDTGTVHPLKEFAADEKRTELSQALAVVALGLLVDPEPRPSLLRLTQGSFYPARTESLDEAFTIL